MAEATYRKATEADARALASNMREPDVRECRAAGSEPLEAALAGVRDSAYCWALEIDGELAALFGVVTLSALSTTAGVWLLGTTVANRHKRRFTIAIGDIVEQLLERYVVLTNSVHIANTDPVKWLKFAGFALCPPTPRPPHGELFSTFYKVGRHVHNPSRG